MQTLTLRSLKARPVVLKLKRPVTARIATITDWPLILIDLHTEEGITGHSYLEPYVVKTMKYLVPALHDLGEMLKGRRIAPLELYDAARKSLHFVGYQGLSMIAVSGLDMAAWDALAKAAELPLCALLGGSVGPVKSYNSNGLWLRDPQAIAEEAVARMSMRSKRSVSRRAVQPGVTSMATTRMMPTACMEATMVPLSRARST